MRKIFINNVPVFLQEASAASLPNSHTQLSITYKNLNDLLEAIKYIEQNNNALSKVHILNPDGEQLIKDFETLYTNIDSAGGLVWNTKGELLMIKRNSRWDLPKGKTEHKERMEQTALREVNEETGIKQLDLKQPFIVPQNQNNCTYHTYYIKGKRVLKTIYWYEMQHTGNEQGTPQQEEGITDVVWVPLNDLTNCLANTYGSIKDLIELSLAQKSGLRA